MDNHGELVWRTSSRSSSGACVAIAADGDLTHVRDSKDPAGPMLSFHRQAFREFIAAIKGDAPTILRS
ncbi:DUF397 domain-containing protein [Dactylosporangium aurantiacum]|uniref:DUF397 domain-containing protein n=1 Tax=Dactylosporangium aurantiacum TaxID=35754 RepID=A0A9Q9IHT7_9ACTN|nr:DUF397 domain-containing protein [Dactylosporangium aurantiacum]MDG6100940.1 DUF397 domain-containing protein [Dactylosporangium aurantiacum]UWZ55008.1 DUF397 domain-containing protein [Dactylosporangium aurantiacum]